MRICLVTFVGPMHSTGGLQDHAASLAAGLVRAGHEVEVISSTHPDGLEEMELDGASWRFVTAPRHHLDPTWLERSTALFSRLHAARPFDVVDSESSSGLGLVRAGVHETVPFVVTFHGNFLTYVRAHVDRILEDPSPRSILRELKGFSVLAFRDHLPKGNWRLMRDCEAIVPSRAQLDDTIASHRLRRERTHVVPNGVDAAFWDRLPRETAREAAGIAPDAFVFASVGRLNRGKGIGEAIAALAIVRQAVPHACLTVVGDGPEEAALRAAAREHGVEDAVHFTGRLDADGVRCVMSAADTLLFPTKHREAAPLVLLQALACRLPVVATDAEAIQEVVGLDGGLLVRAGDVTGLASAMTRLADDAELRTRLAAAGREIVERDYTLERMVDRTLDVFAAAAARAARLPSTR